MTKTQKKSIILCRVYARNTKFKNNYIENSLSFLNRDTVRFCLGAIILSLFCFVGTASADQLIYSSENTITQNTWSGSDQFYQEIPNNSNITITSLDVKISKDIDSPDNLDMKIGIGDGVLDFGFTYGFCLIQDIATTSQWYSCDLPDFVATSSFIIVLQQDYPNTDGFFSIHFNDNVIIGSNFFQSGTYYSDMDLNARVYGIINECPVIAGSYGTTTPLSETLDNSFTLTFTAVYVFFAGIFPHVLALGFIFAFAYLLIGYLENG